MWLGEGCGGDEVRHWLAIGSAVATFGGVSLVEQRNRKKFFRLPFLLNCPCGSKKLDLFL